MACVLAGTAAAAQPASAAALAFNPLRPADPADDSGLYVRGQKAATVAEGPTGQFSPDTLKSPYIRGGFIRLSWSMLEPTEGAYNWAFLDAVVKQLKERGLKYEVSVSAGFDSPKWLLEGSRIQAFEFERKKREAVMSPIPWDGAYLAQWAKFLRALGQRLAGDPDFVAVRVGGVQAGSSLEMGLPKALLDHGYTPEKVKRAWAANLAAYAEAFPGKPFMINVNKLLNAPGESGEQTARAVVDQAVARYGRRLILSNSGINPKSAENGFSADLIRAYTSSDRVLAQLGPWAPITGTAHAMGRHKDDPVEKKLRDTFEAAFRLRAKYLAIDPPDVLDPRLQQGLAWVAAKQEAAEGRPLRFTLQPNEDRPELKYSARNLPQGASFDPATHTFTWTPAPGQAGVYLNVRFEVTDGRQTAAQEVPIIVRKAAR
jgi:hypothetical protein